MLPLLRPLYERWLLRASEGTLAAWQRPLLLRALQRDEALRCLALELADFGHGAGEHSEAPDLRRTLMAEARRDLDSAAEQPLFAAWVPAVALAVIFLVALVALWQPDEAPAPSAAAVDRGALLLPDVSATPTLVVAPKADVKP